MVKLNKIAMMGLVSAMLSITSPLAFSGSMDGFYLSGFLGGTKPLNHTYDNAINQSGYGLKNDWGLNLNGAIGYQSDCFRTELAVGYTKNDDKRLSPFFEGSALSESPNAGDQKALTVMLNGYYDFATDTDIIPFIGAGIGIANIDHDYSVTDSSILYHMKRDDTLFAYQFIAGVGYNLSDNLRASLDYRFLSTTRGDFRIASTNMGSPISYTVGGHYASHQVNLGLTYFII